ncbi:MAG TPA: tetratricopeptide repeat protein, partial [Longimicrobiaceae bacterium]|nr:tetratricopeptide repeat protein [Longimicrobiaceae bacterium]
SGVLDRPAAPFLEISIAAGRTVGRYEILDQLGGGEMGVVYSARDLRLDRLVALKFLPPRLDADDHARERFLVEAKAAAALDHPNICTIHEIGKTDDGNLYIAMPLYDGETLQHRLAQGPLPLEDAIDIAKQVAQGLARAHDRGIVHRDIKPANLIVTNEGVVKIVDFGVAKLAGISLTNAGITHGTVAYMSPEQARGDEVDCRTDVWSLGVVLYEMLTGRRPFRGASDVVILNNIQSVDPGPVAGLFPAIPPALEQVVGRALARQRGDRYQTAGELLQALEEDPSPTAESPPEGERRHVTIVASTIARYDTMVESLVPDEVGRLVGQVRDEALAVATRHGGILNHFAGDEMVLLFGVPATHEDDGIRAARSALELHARVRTLGDRKLRLHTGIDSGSVIVHARPRGNGKEDGTYRIAGSAAQIAGRLASHAGVDEVWTSGECQHLIGPYFRTEAQRPLIVRDRNEPLTPFRVMAESGLQTRFQAAEMFGLTAYIGREMELATLQRCLEAALGGEGQFVTVTGDAGMGKSRLLHEFRNTSDARQAAFLLGRCQSDGGGVPYLPFIEILRTALGLSAPGIGDDVESTVERVREIGPDLDEFIPLYLHLLSIPSTDFPVPKHLHGDTLRLAIQEALAAILTLSASHQPVVVLLEDWHWADEASDMAVKQLAEVVYGSPILLIVTTRPGHGIEWGTPGQHTPLALRPLTLSALLEILKSFLHVETFPAELGMLLHERTGGNPFFLEEICLALIDAGAIVIEGAGARLTGPLQLLDLPDSIQAVIRSRLDCLDKETRDVLRLASVVGRDFTRVILERAVADGQQLPGAMEVLTSAGLIQQIQVVPEAMYRFKHVLTQEVAYASLLGHQRRELHGRVGALIEQLGQHHIEDNLDRLAHHFSRADQWQKAIRYCMRSADRAGALAQYAEALQIFERTQRWLAKLSDRDERQDASLEILLRQERLCETLGFRSRQQQIIDELVSILEPDGDRAKLAEVYLRQGDLFILLRRFDEGEEVLQSSLRIWRELSDQMGEQKTLRSLGMLCWHQGRNAEALTCIGQVVAMDRERGDIVALVGDLTSLANVLKAMNEHQHAILRLEEGIAVAEEALAAGSHAAGDLRSRQAYILNSLAVLYRDAGDLERARDYLDQSEKIVEVGRLPVYLPFHHTIAAHIDLLEGKIEQSIARYRTAVETARKARYVPGLSQMLRIQGEVLLSLNRFADAIPCLEEATTLFSQLEDSETQVHLWSEIATAYEQIDDYPGAIEAWSRTRELWSQLGNAAGELKALEGLGAAARQSAAPALAIGYCNEAVDLAISCEDRVAEGRLRNIIGILEWSRGGYAHALMHFGIALAIFREIDDTANAGLMLNSVALTLKESGELAQARSRFIEAVAFHRQEGHVQLEGHALAALGDISMELGDPQTAEYHYKQSLELRRRIGDRRGEGWMLYKLARNNTDGNGTRELAARASHIAERCGDYELTAACDQLRRTSEHQALA